MRGPRFTAVRVDFLRGTADPTAAVWDVSSPRRPLCNRAKIAHVRTLELGEYVLTVRTAEQFDKQEGNLTMNSHSGEAGAEGLRVEARAAAPRICR
jgi:hypothetical protein